MDIVIQCAATKFKDAGSLKTRDGKFVRFVAQPNLCSLKANTLYARPDDPSDTPSVSWRKHLEKYVTSQGQTNPLELRQAYRLYKPAVYAGLVERFGSDKIFILSAGWGLVKADYLLPNYDVTFSLAAKKKCPSAFCHSSVEYDYFQHLTTNSHKNRPVIFLGGSAYWPVFDRLTRDLRRKRVVFTRESRTASNDRKEAPYDFEYRRFPTKVSTNWHYQCAQALISGKINLQGA